MRLNKLNIRDKKLFEEFLALKEHDLSVYAFENIYICSGIYDIRWAVIKSNLCIFFKDKLGCFLYLPPLSEKREPEAIKEAFRIMDGFNTNKNISRIENLEKEDISFYRDLGYKIEHKPDEYLYCRTDLAQLKGGRFKSKRASHNYFIKHYHFRYLPFSLNESGACIMLYNRWMRNRRLHFKTPLYQGMLKDSKKCLKILFKAFPFLNFCGRVIEINREIEAFTFGFKINSKTFCILYEITDLAFKGLSQFIFRKFCSELEDYRYINIMDDSGLNNLKRVKLSYNPLRLIPSYIAQRKDA